MADATSHAPVASCPVIEINFVTHFMGGVLVRDCLSLNRPVKLSRIVILTALNKGSKIVDAVSNLFIFDHIDGLA